MFKTPRNVMKGDWDSGFSETRETARAAKAWFEEAHEALGQVAPMKAAQVADDAQYAQEDRDWHQPDREVWADWLAEKEAEARMEAFVNSTRGQDMAFAKMYREW